MDKIIRVVLADDHELVLEGLRALLGREPDIQVVAAVTDGTGLVGALRQYRPDVAVVDIQMPTMDGLNALEQIRREGLPTKILLLTAYSDGEAIQSALELEADGIALKTEPPQQTVAAIRQVFHGQLVFPRAARRWLTRSGDDERAGRGNELSDREREVLELVAQGMTNAQIAERMRVSENTVKFHLQNLYQKLGVSNRTEAASYFYRKQTGG